MDEDNLYRNRDDGFRDSSIISNFNFYRDHYDFGWQLPSPPPIYTIDKTLSIRTAEVCPQTGVWYPAIGLERHSLVFGMKGYPMPPAYLCNKTVEELIEKDGENYMLGDIETTAVETIWHPVKLVEPAINDGGDSTLKLRCEANQPCPKAGYWLTPAKLGSRRYFKQGEIMPKFQSDYGMTIWMWDQNQEKEG